MYIFVRVLNWENWIYYGLISTLYGLNILNSANYMYCVDLNKDIFVSLWKLNGETKAMVQFLWSSVLIQICYTELGTSENK